MIHHQAEPETVFKPDLRAIRERKAGGAQNYHTCKLHAREASDAPSMTGQWDTKLPQEFTFPATVGLLVILITVVILFVIHNRSLRVLTGSKGTKYVVDTDGNQVVRR